MLWTLTKVILGIRTDSREPYLTDEDGQPLALVMEGQPGRAPAHEAFSHDGTPHQNPAVRREWRRRTIWGIPWGWKRIEMRYYPLTVAPDGRQADLDDIEYQIAHYRFSNHQDAYVDNMDQTTVQQALKVENAGQQANGVPRWLLREKRAFTQDDEEYIEFGF